MNSSKILTLDEIEEKYNKGEYTTKLDYQTIKMYKSDHVFDENQSVKWNREQIINENKKLLALKEEYKKDKIRLERQLTNDVVVALMDSYGFNQQQAEKIEKRVYNEEHDCMRNYFLSLDDTASFINEIRQCYFDD